MGLLDFTQSASNAIAGNVSAPVDGIAWLLRKAGVPVGDYPVGGSNWMEQQGLTKPVQQSASSLAGETLGLLAPMGIAAKAPQIARGLLQAADNAAVPSALGPMAAQRGAITWHGSPHKFDKFDSSKIGTGEGAQAYGHGLYLAESPSVATTYQNSLSDFDAFVSGKPFNNADAQHRASLSIKEAEDNGHSISDIVERMNRSVVDLKSRNQPWASSLANEQMQTIAALNNGNVPKMTEISKGSLYKVDLPDEHIAKMLDWDNPVSQQPWYKGTPSYEELLATVKLEGRKPTKQEVLLAKIKSPHTNLSESMTGQQLYSNLGKDAVSSANAAKDYGFPGIRYLDGGSRATNAGTSNFVVFPGNEGLLNILERNGSPLP